MKHLWNEHGLVYISTIICIFFLIYDFLLVPIYLKTKFHHSLNNVKHKYAREHIKPTQVILRLVLERFNSAKKSLLPPFKTSNFLCIQNGHRKPLKEARLLRKSYSLSEDEQSINNEMKSNDLSWRLVPEL